MITKHNWCTPLTSHATPGNGQSERMSPPANSPVFRSSAIRSHCSCHPTTEPCGKTIKELFKWTHWILCSWISWRVPRAWRRQIVPGCICNNALLRATKRVCNGICSVATDSDCLYVFSFWYRLPIKSIKQTLCVFKACDAPFVGCRSSFWSSTLGACLRHTPELWKGTRLESSFRKQLG